MLLVSKDPTYSKYHKNDYFKTNVRPNSNLLNLFSLFGVLLHTVSFNELKKSYQIIVSKCKHPSLITGSQAKTICLAISLFEFNFHFIEQKIRLIFKATQKSKCSQIFLGYFSGTKVVFFWWYSNVRKSAKTGPKRHFRKNS